MAEIFEYSKPHYQPLNTMCDRAYYMQDVWMSLSLQHSPRIRVLLTAPGEKGERGRKRRGQIWLNLTAWVSSSFRGALKPKINKKNGARFCCNFIKQLVLCHGTQELSSSEKYRSFLPAYLCLWPQKIKGQKHWLSPCLSSFLKCWQLQQNATQG